MALTNADGTLVRTKKSALLAALEADVMHVEEVPTKAAHIVDAMALIQDMNTATGTFSDFAKSVFFHLLSSGGKAASVSEAPQRIDFVCDQYFDHSIKKCGEKRASSGCLQLVTAYDDSSTRPRDSTAVEALPFRQPKQDRPAHVSSRSLAECPLLCK